MRLPDGLRYWLLRLFLVAFCLELGPTVHAQKQASTWVFGRNAGLRFTPNGVVPFYGSAMRQIEGAAVICDQRTGELLFYSDGMSVWNRLHQPMPNGQGLAGSQTSTQSALIVPAPDKQGFYYLFTVKAYNEDHNQGGLYYSLVDLSQNNGLGDVSKNQKNNLLERFTTEKLTAVPHANGRDYWILSHAWDSNEFIVYALTPTGLSPQRRMAIGTIHRGGLVGGSEAMGYLKASPNSKLLAAAVYGEARPFELYDFNNQTGTIFNYRSLGSFFEQYGVSFSPDNSKLYLSGIGPTSGSYQFDLADPNYPATPLTLLNTVEQTPEKSFIAGSLQLGLDGKLYGSSDEGKMVVINKPNLKGVACDARPISFDFKGSKPLLGLPNFIQAIFDSTADTTSHPVDADTSLAGGCQQALKVYPNPVMDGSLWIEANQASCPLEWVKLYDVSGRYLAQIIAPTEKIIRLDVTQWLGAGQEYLLVFKVNDKLLTRKVIKP